MARQHDFWRKEEAALLRYQLSRERAKKSIHVCERTFEILGTEAIEMSERLHISHALPQGHYLQPGDIVDRMVFAHSRQKAFSFIFKRPYNNTRRVKL